MDKKKAIEITKQFTRVVNKHFPVRMVILYGSYAKGVFREHSDIDIAVVIDKIEGDFLSASAQLHRFVWDIDTRIEPVLIENNKDKSGFLDGILEYGIVIYEKGAA